MERTNSQSSAKDHIAAVQQLREWLERAGVDAPGMAVDMIDSLAAARQVELLVNQIVRIDVSTADCADRVLEQLGILYVLLFSEMKPHLRDLEKAWPRLESAIIARTTAKGPDR